MTSPLIGLTTYGRAQTGQYALYDSYITAVRQAGGIPILLPPGETHLESILTRIDGLILTGGGDIAPDQYGGPDHPTIYKVDPERDAFELRLAELALAQPMPILGICRGLQILGLASGVDTLYAHIPDAFGTQTQHRTEDAQPLHHAVRLLSDSRLAQYLGTETLTVTSWHHQAIPTVPKGWQAVGWAPDGLIEAIEHQHHPWAIAVQWHPEMFLDNPDHRQLFSVFVAAVQQAA